MPQAKPLPLSRFIDSHHQLYGHEFEQALGAGDGRGGLACMDCSPWCGKELNMTERLN